MNNNQSDVFYTQLGIAVVIIARAPMPDSDMVLIRSVSDDGIDWQHWRTIDELVGDWNRIIEVAASVPVAAIS